MSENRGLQKTWNHAHGARVPQEESGCAWSDCSAWHRSSPFLPSPKEKVSPVQPWHCGWSIPHLPWVSANQPPSHSSLPRGTTSRYNNRSRGQPPPLEPHFSCTRTSSDHSGPLRDTSVHTHSLQWLAACCPTQLPSVPSPAGRGRKQEQKSWVRRDKDGRFPRDKDGRFPRLPGLEEGRIRMRFLLGHVDLRMGDTVCVSHLWQYQSTPRP